MIRLNPLIAHIALAKEEPLNPAHCDQFASDVPHRYVVIGLILERGICCVAKIGFAIKFPDSVGCAQLRETPNTSSSVKW